jgi:predicted RNase H-like nuclease
MPQHPEVVPTFADVLDMKPAFTIVAVHVPIGLPDEGVPGGRGCDRAARAILGHPRQAAILSPPTPAALSCPSWDAAREVMPGLSPASWMRRRAIAEVNTEMQPYRQRTVYEVAPELAFLRMNEDAPLRHGKRTPNGRHERRELLEGKLRGVDAILDARLPRVAAHQLIDAAANLLTARMLAARAVTRLPQDPEWDANGLRAEIVY